MIDLKGTEIIKIEELVATVTNLRNEGYRIVQIGCTGPIENNFEINYTFDKDLELLNFRILVPIGQEIPSIQSIYACSFIYENELLDLYGIKITDMIINFNGKLYKTAGKTPFNPPSEEKI